MDWTEHISRIPEPLITGRIFDDDDEHRGHSTYTGHGSGKNGDYWDCYCLREGCEPPTDLEDFLRWVDNPEQVREWYIKYKFTMIVCFCWCCQGADPAVMYGWPKNLALDPNTPKDPDDSDNEIQYPERWTASSNKHAFFVTLDKKLVYYGDIIDVDKKRCL